MSSALMPMLRMIVSQYPLAQLFSYASGTTTKQNNYNNPDLAVGHANANPLIADANGLFGPIYLDPSLSYKFVLAPTGDTDPPAAPIFTDDPVGSQATQLLTILAKTANYVVVSTDGDDVTILADATAGAITISPYTAIGNTGRKLRVVKVDSSVNAVTIDPNGTQTWDGLTTRILSAQWEAAAGASDGANWVEVGQAIGFGISTSARWKLTGTFTPTGATGADRVIDVGVTVALEANANGAGVYVNPTFTEAGSGTHAIIAGLWIPQITITNAAAAVTNAAGLYIANAPSVTGGSAWAMWVAAGASRFDEDIVFGVDKTIRRNTADGSDSGNLWLTGGGNNSATFATIQTQGAVIRIGGNEAGISGSVQIGPGNVAGSAITFVTSANSTMFQQLGSDGSAVFTSSKGAFPLWDFVSTHASTPSGIRINYTAAAPNDTGNIFLRAADTGATRFEVRSNGGIANFSANNVNLSDAEWKDILGPVGSYRDSFRRLALVHARYKDAPEAPSDVMVTAQNVAEIYPSLISGFDGHLGVREHGLMMRAFKVIQELDVALLDHNSRLVALERSIH